MASLQKSGLSSSVASHQKQVTKVVIHACDLSNPTLPFQTYMNWAYLITQEFNQQTKKEESKGVAVTPFLVYSGIESFYQSQLFFSSIVSL